MITISRQLRKQRRWKREGLCTICGAPRHPDSKARCVKHLLAARRYMRHRTGSRSHKVTGRGRPSIEV